MNKRMFVTLIAMIGLALLTECVNVFGHGNEIISRVQKIDSENHTIELDEISQDSKRSMGKSEESTPSNESNRETGLASK